METTRRTWTRLGRATGAALATATLLITAACSGDSGSSSSSESDDDATSASTGSSEADPSATSDATEPTATTESTEAGSDPTVSDDFCANVTAMVDTLDGFGDAFETSDYAAFVSWSEEFVPIGEAVVATAPADQAANVDLAMPPLLELTRTIAQLDPSDEDAIDQAFQDAFADIGRDVERAGDEVLRSCGLDPDDL